MLFTAVLGLFPPWTTQLVHFSFLALTVLAVLSTPPPLAGGPALALAAGGSGVRVRAHQCSTPSYAYIDAVDVLRNPGGAGAGLAPPAGRPHPVGRVAPGRRDGGIVNIRPSITCWRFWAFILCSVLFDVTTAASPAASRPVVRRTVAVTRPLFRLERLAHRQSGFPVFRRSVSHCESVLDVPASGCLLGLSGQLWATVRLPVGPRAELSEEAFNPVLHLREYFTEVLGPFLLRAAAGRFFAGPQPQLLRWTGGGAHRGIRPGLGSPAPPGPLPAAGAAAAAAPADPGGGGWWGDRPWRRAVWSQSVWESSRSTWRSSCPNWPGSPRRSLASGRTTREEILNTRLPVCACQQYINRELPADARVDAADRQRAVLSGTRTWATSCGRLPFTLAGRSARARGDHPPVRRLGHLLHLISDRRGSSPSCTPTYRPNTR